jgi:hypothetical protein
VATSEMVTRLILSRCFRSAGWAPTCHRNLSIQMRHCHAVFAQRWFVTGRGELVYELVGKLVTPGFTDSRVRVVTVRLTTVPPSPHPEHLRRWPAWLQAVDRLIRHSMRPLAPAIIRKLHRNQALIPHDPTRLR